jgi:hypothetical protein
MFIFAGKKNFMKIKYLSIIPLFVANVTVAQELLSTTPLPVDITNEIPETAASAFVPDIATAQIPEAYAAPRLPFSNDGIGVSRVSFYVNFQGGYNLSTAAYGGKSASGGGLRWQADMGAKIPIGGNNTVCDNFLSVGIGGASIRIKDEYKTAGVVSEAKNDYTLGGVLFPISFTSVNYKFADYKGLYWTVGANIGVMKPSLNGKDISASCNKVAFEPFASFGYSVIQELKRGRIAMQNVLIGPVISFNPVNLYNTPNSRLNYFSFGVQVTGIAMEWN